MPQFNRSKSQIKIRFVPALVMVREAKQPTKPVSNQTNKVFGIPKSTNGS